MGIISDFKVFFYWHKMLAYLLALGYIVLVLSLIIAQQNEDINMLRDVDDNQYNTQTEQYFNKRKYEKEYHFIHINRR